MTDVDESTATGAPKYKARYSLVTYATETHPQKLLFRGMVADDIPPDVAEKYLAEGAIVAADLDLDSPGELAPLRAGSSNEELLNWAMAASQVEIEQQIARDPAMAQRLREAWAVKQRVGEEEARLLGQRIATLPEPSELAPVDDQAPGALVSADEPGDPNLAAGVRSLGPQAPHPEVPNTDAPLVDSAYFDDVVKAHVKDVADFLSKYPQYAAGVLAAENRRAEAEKAEPRKGVEQAVQAAAGFTQ